MAQHDSTRHGKTVSGIRRRDFMEGAAAVGLTAAVASPLLGRSARAATPRKGGRARFGIGHGSTSDSLDPATYLDTYMQTVGFALRNCLTEINNKDELVPELAESWDVSDDAARWVFKLRKGVEFHNGKTLEAADVVASLNHHRGEETKSPAKELLAPVKEIKADGKDTVVIQLEGGNADFAFLMSDYHMPIMPAKADGGIEWRSGVGTGGYILESYEPGVRTSMTRNPNYWKEGHANFDELEVLSIKDPAARTNALTTGEVDVIDRVEYKTANLLNRRSGVHVDETEATKHYTFTVRTDTPPFDDNNVRLALKYAINREELLEKILLGYGYPGNDHPIGRSNRFFADELAQRQQDLDKAKFHLKKAGLSSLEINLSAADAAWPGSVDGAVLYKEQARPAGIEITVVREPNDGYWSDVWMKKPFCAVYWSGRPTSDWMFSIAYAEGAAWNDSFWKHDRFNKLLKEARAELDRKKRQEMYAEMQSLVRDEGGVIIPMFANNVFAMSDKVQHKKEMAGAWDLDGLKAMERWWFAA